MNPSAPRAPIELMANALYLGAAALLLYALVSWLLAQPAFALRHVEVRGALGHVDEAQVRLLAAREVRGNFFTVDLARVRDGFERLSWVSEARVARQWPDRLVVELAEHQPLGAWNGKALVSTEGVVINAAADRALPKLSGEEASAAAVSQAYLKFSSALRPIGMQIAELSYSARHAWRLKTTSGLEIALGREQAQERLARFVAQYARTAERIGAAPAYADLRYADGFALRAAHKTDKQS